MCATISSKARNALACARSLKDATAVPLAQNMNHRICTYFAGLVIVQFPSVYVVKRAGVVCHLVNPVICWPRLAQVTSEYI